jgi:hypothetical protein
VLFIGEQQPLAISREAANHERVEPPGKRSGIGRHLAVEDVGLVSNRAAMSATSASRLSPKRRPAP